MGRAAAILGAFDADRSVLSLAELGELSKPPRSTAHRIASELVTLGMLARVDGGYELGTKLWEIGELAPVSLRLREAALPHLQTLYEATGETFISRYSTGQRPCTRRACDGHDIRSDRDPDGRAPAAAHVAEVEADLTVQHSGEPLGQRIGGYFREYPFAWFGILCEAPPSAPELIYSASDEGFALISQRSATVQRMYLQCDPQLDPQAMSDAEVGDALQRRVPGTALREGPIFQRDVLRFRSFVAYELQRGNVFLMGDAAHTVPPTGAKGMNLAVADVVLLHQALRESLRAGGRSGSHTLIDGYAAAASDRIWRAQHFSWWMTSMLHAAPEATEFDTRRRLGELTSVVRSRGGSTYLAEAYTGWPLAGSQS